MLRCLVVCSVLLLGGCGFVWDSGGQRHALGFGYIAWPLPDQGRAAVVTGEDVIGAGVLATRNSVGAVVGYSRQRAVTLDGDHVLTLDCLQCDLARAHAAGGTAAATEGAK